MPTVLRAAGLRFIIWPDDHLPPHVHAFGAEGSAKIAIGSSSTPPRLMAVTGLSRKQVAEALRAVAANRKSMLDIWERIHGKLDR